MFGRVGAGRSTDPRRRARWRSRRLLAARAVGGPIDALGSRQADAVVKLHGAGIITTTEARTRLGIDNPSRDRQMTPPARPRRQQRDRRRQEDPGPHRRGSRGNGDHRQRESPANAETGSQNRIGDQSGTNPAAGDSAAKQFLTRRTPTAQGHNGIRRHRTRSHGTCRNSVSRPDTGPASGDLEQQLHRLPGRADRRARRSADLPFDAAHLESPKRSRPRSTRCSPTSRT